MTVTYTRTDVAGKADFQTNTVTTGSQSFPDVLGLSNGGFVSAYNNPTQGGIVVDFYDANYNHLVDHFPADVDTSTTVPVGQPSLTQLANGNVLVVWEESDSSSPGLRGHLYSPTGTPIGTELELGLPDHQYKDPQVVALVGGGFALGWDSASSVPHLARYTDAGDFIDVYNSAVFFRSDTAVAALADGGYLISYTDSSNAADKNIKAVIRNADGTMRTGEFVIDTATQNQTQAKVVGLPDGNFAAVYTDASYNEAGTGGTGIKLQILSATGVNESSLVHVNAVSTVDESEPDVTVLANGFILVTWTRPFENHPTTDRDVYGRVFDQLGDLVLINGSSAEFVIANLTADELHPAVSHITGGKFITSWQDGTSDGSGGSIHATISEITRSTVGGSTGDILVSDQLRDTFTAGGGNDLYVYTPGGNADTWTDFTPGAAAFDQIDLRAFLGAHNLAGVLAHATQSGGSPVNTLLDFGNGDSLMLQGVAKASLTADDFIFNPLKDFNADGFGDVLFRNNATGDTGYTDIHNNVFHSLGGSPTAYSVVGSADYNGDGFSDILFRNNATGDTGYTDLHNNVFQSLGGSPVAYSVVESGDYNGDGFADILFRNNSTGDTGYTDLNNNVFHSLGGSPTAFSVVGSGDYNGDNFADILFRNNATGDTGYTDLHNNVFHSLGGSPVAYRVVGSGDYNGDGFSDILFRNNSTGDTGYTDLHNNVFHGLGGSPVTYSVVGSADYNGDGFADILFRNNSTGDTGYTDIHNNVFHSLGSSPAAYLVMA
jgi:hypothetical protein